MAANRVRVLFDASALPERPAGAGVYTLELAKALSRRADVDVVAAAPRELPGLRVVPSPRGNALRRNSWEQFALPLLLQGEQSDVVHGAHMAVPLRSPVPRVATVHDLTFFRIPRRYSRRHRAYYRLLARLSRHAARIIVPSKTVAGDVVRYLKYPLERIRVIPEAARDGLGRASDAEVEALCDRLGVERGYLLCVGTAEPGKRAVDAVRALPLLRAQGDNRQLLLAGNEGRLSGALRREAERLGVGDRVRFVGYMPGEDLAALYTGALALIFPSLYEGFGLPPLEAMVCGTPVITSQAPAMDDVLAGGAIFVPLRDPRAIAAETLRLAAEPAWWAENSARGREVAAKYSWDRAAAETVEVYRDVLA